jgi:Redoxin
LGERNAARGLRVVGVTKHGADAEEKAEVEKAAADHGMTAPSFLDAKGAWCAAAGVRLEPTFLLLDRAGKVAYRHAGKLTVESDAFKAMTDLLAKM